MKVNGDREINLCLVGFFGVIFFCYLVFLVVWDNGGNIVNLIDFLVEKSFGENVG